MSQRSKGKRVPTPDSTPIDRPRSRRRFLCHRTSKALIQRVEIQRAIHKEKRDKTGLAGCQINCILYNIPNFIGCFAQDELKTLIIRSLPVSLIANLDHSGSEGSHWIALRISQKSLEIFDPLGFNVNRWPGKIPYFLLHFLHKFSIHRRVYISKEIQPDNSTLCGFYCIFFLYYRLSHTFTDCLKPFSLTNLGKNDDILETLFE